MSFSLEENNYSIFQYARLYQEVWGLQESGDRFFILKLIVELHNVVSTIYALSEGSGLGLLLSLLQLIFMQKERGLLLWWLGWDEYDS